MRTISKSLDLFISSAPSFGVGDPDCEEILSKILIDVRKQNNFNEDIEDRVKKIFEAQLNGKKVDLTTEEEDRLYENFERIAPFLRTPRVTDILADRFSTMGIKSSDGVKGTWDLLRSADMEDQSIFDLLEFIESRLPNNFLSLDYKPEKTTRYLQKKYGITPQEYKQIAENIDL